MTEQYLESIHSKMEVRDYLASIWALTYGAAAILNSCFYQRYLGSRDTLRVAYIDQALAMPKQDSFLKQIELIRYETYHCLRFAVLRSLN